MMEKYLNVDGNKWFVQVEGSGKPLLFLHGFTGSAQAWAGITPSFVKRYQVVTIDFLGHGKSDAPREVHHYSMEKSLAALRTLMESFAEPFGVVGYSMGGRVALALTCTHPELVDLVVLESTSPGLRDARDRELRRESDDALASSILENGIASFVEYWENIPLFASQKKLPDTKIALQRERRLRNREIGLAGSLRGIGTGSQLSYWENLASIRQPALLITGEEDHKYRKIAAKMMDELPSAEHITVDRVGHAVHFEDSDTYISILRQFFDRHRF